jgi:transposase
LREALGMNEIPPIITERVDDIPLLLEQMLRMGLPALFDDHFPTHGNWHGLSLGWVTTIWLSAILSRGAHRLVHVEPWVAKRLWTLRATTGHAVTRLDCPDDRLAIVLQRLPDDTRWAAFASALHQHTVRVYALPTARVHVESTRASADTTVTEHGLLPCGHSTEDRPDLPHVTVMQAVRDPLGMPLATEVVSGARADAPLSVPGIQRVQASRGRRGLLSVGDGTRASRATRAFLAGQGDVSVCPLPLVPRAEDAWAEALEAVWSGAHALSPVVRTRQDGTRALRAEGEDRQVPMRLEVAGQLQRWTERRVVVRSIRQAQAAEGGLRARVATAMAASEALNQRGRGKQRFAEVSA